MFPSAEMRVRLDDRFGVAAFTYVLFGLKPGPALALSMVFVFAIWIGWRWLRRKSRQSPLYGAPAVPRVAREGSNLASGSKPAVGVVDICRGVPYRRAG
jgi:hypothetical protein